MESASEEHLIVRPRRRRRRRQRTPPPPPPSAFAATFAKNLVLLTRCPRGSLGDRLGPSSVFAWRALFPALLAAFDAARATPGKPHAIVVDTLMGKGVKAFEDREKNHFIRVAPDEWALANQQLEATS